MYVDVRKRVNTSATVFKVIGGVYRFATLVESQLFIEEAKRLGYSVTCPIEVSWDVAKALEDLENQYIDAVATNEWIT